MIIDWTAGTYAPLTLYANRGFVRTYNATVAAPLFTLVGQWSNAIALHSNQPTITLTGQEVITLGSNQETYRVELD